jgi:hypothetical protein
MTLIRFVLSAWLLSLPLAASAQESVEDCRAIDNAEERLACYDRMAPPAEPEPPASAPKPSPAPKPEPAQEAVEPGYAPLTDDVGDERLAREDGEDDFKPVRAHVVDCKRDSFNDYFFYFENGQVWKQRTDSRLSFRECDFWVTITKDFFGYKMQVDGEKKQIRIGRIR